MLKHIVFCFLFMFSIVRFSNAAEIANLEDIIIAAEDDIEPAYIKYWSEELSKKLNTIAQKIGLETPKQKLSWLHTMTGIIRDTYEAASEAALDAVEGDYTGSVYKVTKEQRVAHARVTYLGFLGASSASYKAINAPVCEYAKNIARNALPAGASRDVTGRIAYRVAEWAALNWLLENIELIFDDIYESAENSLEENPRNPFVSDDALRVFMTESFINLKEEAMYFIAPWLVQVASLEQIPEEHQPLFIKLRILNGMCLGLVIKIQVCLDGVSCLS